MKKQLRKNISYYFEVLNRVVEVITFLRESSEILMKITIMIQKPSLMGILETIVKFNSFLHENLEKYAKRKTSNS